MPRRFFLLERAVWAIALLRVASTVSTGSARAEAPGAPGAGSSAPAPRSKWLDPGEWRPSVGISFGIAYRNGTGWVDGAIRTSGTVSTDPTGRFVLDTTRPDRRPVLCPCMARCIEDERATVGYARPRTPPRP